MDRTSLMPLTVWEALTLACLTIALPTSAHHSAAMFDTTKEIMVEGVVTDFAWKNPHSSLTVRTATGPLVMELGPPSTLGPLGLKKETIKVGDRVTVRGNPPRTGKVALARELIRPDGSTVPLILGGQAQRPPPVAKTETIAGTWVPEGFFSFLQSRAKWPLTDKGRAALQSANSKLSTQNECIPVGAPMVMHYPVANRIVIGRNVVRIIVDWMGAERIVYLDGRKPPANAKRSLQGHSTGKWEGTTLVIDTTQFAEHREGNALGLPSGLNKHLVERFSLSEDRQHLTYEFVLEDPDWFTAPVKQSIQWDYHPEIAPSGVKCDIKSASRYLKEG
ncbi:MAG: DUF6152 family protein [Steroidobacteraceae bacterium]